MGSLSRLKASTLGALLSSSVFGLVESSSAVYFNVSDHLLFSNARDAGEVGSPLTNLLMHEDRIGVSWRNLSTGIHFTNSFTSDTVGNNKPWVLEKKFFAAEWDHWKLRAGDSHFELGRGIALSLYENPVFGLNNTVEGGVIECKAPSLKVGILGGRINALKSPVALNPQTTSLVDNEVWLGGGTVGGEILENTVLSGHYLIALNRPLSGNVFDKRWHTAGGSLQQEWSDEVETYVETNVLFPQRLDGSVRLREGWGSYLNLAWTPEQWRWKVEAKDYRNYAFEFRRPPTLEEDIIESVNISDTSALRLYGERTLSDRQASIYASYLVGDDRLALSAIHHPLVGVKFSGPWKSKLEAKLGYRTLPGKSNLSHVALKTKLPTWNGQALELGFRKQYSNLNLNFSPTIEDRNAVDLGYTFSRHMTTLLGYEFLPHRDPLSGQHFANLSAMLTWASLHIKALVGRTSGGTLCSGGVCRQVPPYNGAMVETVYTF